MNLCLAGHTTASTTVVVVLLFLWFSLVLGFLLDLVLFVGEVAKAGGYEGTGR